MYDEEAELNEAEIASLDDINKEQESGSETSDDEMNVLSYYCQFCQKLFSEKIMLSTTLKSAQRQWMKMTLIMMKIEIFAVPTVMRNSTLKTMFSYIWTLTSK